MASSLIALLAALVSGFAAQSATAPPGARLDYVSEPGLALNYEVGSVGAEGQQSAPLAELGRGRNGIQVPMNESRVSWSRGGTRFALEAAPPYGEGHGYGFGVYVGNADGTDFHLVPGSDQDFIIGQPLITPDGKSVVIEREVGNDSYCAFFSFPVDGGKPRRLTPPREILEPSAFTPDGKAIAVTRYGPRGDQAATVALGSGKITVIAGHAAEPSFGPHGMIVAKRDLEPSLLKGGGEKIIASELLLITPGSAPEVIARIKRGLAWPTIDPSGERIAFTRLRGGTTPVLSGRRNSIAEINVDGTCLKQVVKAKETTVAGSTWQPGPGRGAGPISC